MGRARQLASRGNNDSILLDASAASTDVGERILLDGTDASSTNAGFFITTEDETNQNFNLDLNGDKQIVLDADGDSAIFSTSDDLVTIKVAGQPRVAVDQYGQLTFYSDDNEVSPTTKATIYNTDSALNIYAASNSAVDKGIAFHTSSDGGSSALAIGGAAAADVTVKTGDIVFGAAGKGVNLGVTSNTDANTLDDYEEGTFTPLWKYGGTDNTDSSAGTYVKVGTHVTIACTMNLVNSESGSGAITVTGLPFAFVDNASVSQRWYVTGNDYVDLDRLSVSGANNAATMNGYIESDGTGSTLANATNSVGHDSNSGKKIHMAFTYISN